MQNKKKLLAICQKEVIKCDNIMKQQKNDYDYQ